MNGWPSGPFLGFVSHCIVVIIVVMGGVVVVVERFAGPRIYGMCCVYVPCAM